MIKKNKENLMNKNLIDLKEILLRENKLLSNKTFISKLNDKGEKIKKFRDEVIKAIKYKESLEETESFLAKLNLGEKIVLNQPMLTVQEVNSRDQRLAKESNLNKKEENKNIIKEIINGDLDIYSVALTKTFDKNLSDKRLNRFIPNKIPEELKKIDSDTKKDTKFLDKYKNTALESFDNQNKFVSLDIENSLEFGKDQKVKDFQVEKLLLEKKLSWRKIIEFDTDDDTISETESSIDDDEY